MNPGLRIAAFDVVTQNEHLMARSVAGFARQGIQMHLRHEVLDLACVPPFNRVWDPVQAVATRMTRRE